MQMKKAANKATDRYVRNFLGCGGVITSEQSQLCMWTQWIYFQFTMQWFREMGGYTEDLKQTTKLSKLGWGGVVGACAGMGACVEMVACPG